MSEFVYVVMGSIDVHDEWPWPVAAYLDEGEAEAHRLRANEAALAQRLPKHMSSFSPDFEEAMKARPVNPEDSHEIDPFRETEYHIEKVPLRRAKGGGG